MQVREDIVAAIGNTPLIALRRASAATGCTILGKAEFMNPGQSVKDRPGRQMILDAERRGDLKPGGLVVEATAGNTGIGLALVASARGYRSLIVIPDTQSQEKRTCCGSAAPSSSRCQRCPMPIRTTISMSDGGWRMSCAKASPTACCSPISG